MKDIFLKDIKNHKMEILLDNGLYRHLIFSDGTYIYRFEIMTFPNCLTITGDMGTFTFSRLKDMFCFFRKDELIVNTGYWHEKMIGDSCYIPARKWSMESFKENVMECYNNWIKDLDEEEIEDIKERVDNLLYFADSEYEAVCAINNWDSNMFQNFWECSCMEKTHQYVWCLYAIVWAIQQYDKEI